MYKLVIFAVVSAGILYLSRAALRAPRSHGFYRFFAWEGILVLGLLNLEQWFVDPWAWHQLIAWTLLLVAFIPLGFGVRALITRGKPGPQREGEAHLLAFEKTTTLVTTGIYRYIRHPLYSSLVFLTWGIFFKAPGWAGLLLALGVMVFLVATARADETECRRFFGPPYQAYMRQTKMFVPFLF